LQGQNICGPAAEGLALLLSQHGIQSEIVTVDLPDLANYSANSHTFLRIKELDSLIVDPSYMQFLKGFTDCKRLDDFPSIALFKESDLGSVVDSLIAICAKSSENIFTAVRYDLSGAVKRQSLLNPEQVKKYLLGIWSITESNLDRSSRFALSNVISVCSVLLDIKNLTMFSVKTEPLSTNNNINRNWKLLLLCDYLPTIMVT
ncbi:MAG: hypothetical protein EB163_09090, partial [Nitrososphaeria archaeon]|nr:hypothetical protein [Nitrososphaeria archaeon]